MDDNICIGARPADQALVSDQAASRLAPSGFDPSRIWHATERIPYSTMGYGGGTALLSEDGANIGIVITINKSPDHNSRDLDKAVYDCLRDRTAAIRWANQSIEMLQTAFFPLASALRDLEAYLQATPHHNAPEAAAARKALHKFDEVAQ